MTDNTPMGKSQDHRSNALAFAGLGVQIAMIIVGIKVHVLPSVPVQVIAIAGTVFFAIVNFANTVEENKPWKSYGAMIFLMAVAAAYAGPIGTAYIHQP